MPAWLISWLCESIGGWLLGREADSILKKIEEKKEPTPVSTDQPSPPTEEKK